MALLNKLRKTLHRKAWEMLTPTPSAPTAGSFITTMDALGVSTDFFYMNSASSVWLYSAAEDGWLQLPASGATGAFGAGSCGDAIGKGMLGGAATNTATAGTTTTLTTNRTIVRNLVGAKVRVVAGAGAGYEGSVSSNTIGANSVITVTPASGTAFGATTVFEVYSGSLWFFNAGTSSVGFSVYDVATNTWTAKSVTGLPTAWGTCGQLVSTRPLVLNQETGTSTGTNTTTTLNNTAEAWVVNALSNYQVRITAGTGVGQSRTIASNTATALTVSAAWTTTPDATSQYVVEPNDDYLYLLGNNAVTLYRYSISGNTWSTLTPGTARAGGMAAGGTADWIGYVPEWANLLAASSGLPQNGRYIYSFRGSANLDIYDIASNTWINARAYGSSTESFDTGSCSIYNGEGKIYIQKGVTGRIFYLDVYRNALMPFTTNLYPQSTTVAADLMTVGRYLDTNQSDKIEFLYTLLHSRTDFLRMLVI